MSPSGRLPGQDLWSPPGELNAGRTGDGTKRHKQDSKSHKKSSIRIFLWLFESCFVPFVYRPYFF